MKLYDFIQWSIVIAMLFAIVALLTKKDGRGNIIAALKGRRPYAYGFCWKYVE